MQTPKITVITACYNAQRFIEETIKSVLRQTYKDFEYIIVDDGSTDSTVACIQKFQDERIKLIQQQNSGPGAARNRALAEANGAYIAIVDADDISTLDRFQLQLYFLDNNPDCVGVAGWYDVITEIGEYIYTAHYNTDRDYIQREFDNGRFPINHPTMLFRKEIMQRVGGYSVNTSHGEDYIMMKAMSKIGYFACLADSLIKYRFSCTSLTNKSSNVADRLYLLLHKLTSDQHLTEEEIEFLKFYHKNDNVKEKHYQYNLKVAKAYFRKTNNIIMGIKYTKIAFYIAPYNLNNMVLIPLFFICLFRKL